MVDIDRLIINSPYEEPTQYWKFNEETQEYERKRGRRPAGYVRATEANQRGEMRGVFVEIPLANIIRERVKKWRMRGRNGITATTRALFEHWEDASKRNDRLFFCQIEALDTVVWMAEARDSEKIGIDVPGDGGEFVRMCLKMATGTGKTIVMAMLMAWQTLNKVDNPNDSRFSKNFLIMAPGLTVKSRLRVLWPPDSEESYFRKYSLVPNTIPMYENLKEAKVVIHNWHIFLPMLDEHSVDLRRRISESNASFARRMLYHEGNKIIVINDEAHHAWRKQSVDDYKKSQEEREMEQMATKWMEGLDRIHQSREIRICYDFTATPYVPSGKKSTEESLFKWIISDFSLNDAIESGLVKTPRMPVGDYLDLSSGDNPYYHLYEHEDVKPSLKNSTSEDAPLPRLVRTGYMILAKDWERTRKQQKGSKIPPVMITICNSMKTSARIIKFFKNELYNFGELAEDDTMVRIDTKILKMENGKKGDKEYESLRDRINTTGQIGESGEQLKNIIAVQMLSEGWDAKNVTQIMGLRAFESQLLCEQVVGRGLRRQSYELNEDGMFNVEYVNILGVPFSFLPHEGNVRSKKEKPRIEVRPISNNIKHEICWPNIARIETMITSDLRIEWDKMKILKISARDIDDSIRMAPIIEKIPKLDEATELDLRDADANLRMQAIIFYVVHTICRNLEISEWNGSKGELFAQVIKITEKFVQLGKIKVTNMPDDLEIRRNLAIMFNMEKVINHVQKSIQSENIHSKKLIFGSGGTTRSTKSIRPWYTTKGVIENVKKSHIGPSPYDNDWERKASVELEKNNKVISWVKNDRLGFAISYMDEGIIRDYYPDFLVKLGNENKSAMLILEIKGQKSSTSDAKHDALKKWIEAVNANGRFGTWVWDVAYDSKEVSRIIKQHSPSNKTTSVTVAS